MLSIRRTIGAGRGNASMFSGQSSCKPNLASLLLFIAILGTSQAFGAELFPFSPPTSQRRALDQPPQVRPQLSKEDISRAARLADQAKTLTPKEHQQFQESIRYKQKEAIRQSNLSQAQYYTELLTQLGKDTR